MKTWTCQDCGMACARNSARCYPCRNRVRCRCGQFLSVPGERCANRCEPGRKPPPLPCPSCGGRKAESARICRACYVKPKVVKPPPEPPPPPLPLPTTHPAIATLTSEVVVARNASRIARARGMFRMAQLHAQEAEILLNARAYLLAQLARTEHQRRTWTQAG